jgi:DnaK suppressor protein
MKNEVGREAVRRSLETERATLQANIAEETKELDEREENLADVFDVAEESSEQELTSTLLAQSRHHLHQVEAALRRLDAGTYGLCERCGQAIRPERLSALPYATTCLPCQTQQEQANV